MKKFKFLNILLLLALLFGIAPARATLLAQDRVQVIRMGSVIWLNSSDFTGSTLPDPVTEAHGGTNQTSYTTGDTLVATASNTLGKKAVGFNGAVMVANSNSTGGEDWAVECGEKIPVISGNYLQTFSFAATSSATITANTTYLAPITVCFPQTFTALSFAPLVITGANFKVAIYASDSAGKITGAPIVSGAVASVTTASATNEDGTVTATLFKPGRYWEAIVSDTTGTATVVGSAAQGNIYGGPNMTANTGGRYTISNSYATGFGDLTSTTPTYGAGNNAMFLGLKAQ